MPITEEIRRLAREEVKNPSGAYDQVRQGGRHPLFYNLAYDGDNTMPSNFARTIQKRFAGDQDPEMPPRGEEDYNQGEVAPQIIDANDAIQFVRLILARLDPGERAIFAEALGQMTSTGYPAEQTGNVRDNNLGSLDRRGARDGEVQQRNQVNGILNNQPRNAQDRPRKQAQDAQIRSARTALHSSNFNKRWGKLTNNIKGIGFGDRY